ncbi:hypothetical protein EDD85DRAFT_794048 [Armillaria nabsnona]|nr:hypothetical protein EDD85DRAFT_794048 [Armillaria nabsnona]
MPTFNPSFHNLLESDGPEVTFPWMLPTIRLTQNSKADLETALRSDPIQQQETHQIEKRNVERDTRQMQRAMDITMALHARGYMIPQVEDEEHFQDTLFLPLPTQDAETVAKRVFETSGSVIMTGIYHANKFITAKEYLYPQWKRGEIKVVCTTTAVGLGIDKGDVRFVIYHLSYSVMLTEDSFRLDIFLAPRDKPLEAWKIAAITMKIPVYSKQSRKDTPHIPAAGIQMLRYSSEQLKNGECGVSINLSFPIRKKRMRKQTQRRKLMVEDDSDASESGADSEEDDNNDIHELLRRTRPSYRMDKEDNFSTLEDMYD